jgi:hypothetical protein
MFFENRGIPSWQILGLFLLKELKYRVVHMYLNDFLKMGVASKWVKPRLQNFLCFFKHDYGKLFWKFGDHSFNFSFVHGPSWLRVLESIHRYGVIFTFWKKKSKGHCEAMLDVKKYTILTFKGICMNFLLEFKKIILSHPVTSKQPHKIVQIHMRHPVDWAKNASRLF